MLTAPHHPRLQPCSALLQSQSRLCPNDRRVGPFLPQKLFRPDLLLATPGAISPWFHVAQLRTHPDRRASPPAAALPSTGQWPAQPPFPDVQFRPLDTDYSDALSRPKCECPNQPPVTVASGHVRTEGRQRGQGRRTPSPGMLGRAHPAGTCCPHKSRPSAN